MHQALQFLDEDDAAGALHAAGRATATGVFNVATEDDNDGNREDPSLGLDEKVVADHLAAIDAAADEDSLKRSFAAGWKAAEAAKDKGAMRLLSEHKDARKKAIGVKA